MDNVYVHIHSERRKDPYMHHTHFLRLSSPAPGSGSRAFIGRFGAESA